MPAEQIPPRDEGFTVQRNFYALEDKENKTPLQEATVGEVLRGNIQITVPKIRRFVAVEDFVPAGFEIGTRIEISVIEPEKAAQYLKEQQIK